MEKDAALWAVRFQLTTDARYHPFSRLDPGPVLTDGGLLLRVGLKPGPAPSSGARPRRLARSRPPTPLRKRSGRARWARGVIHDRPRRSPLRSSLSDPDTPDGRERLEAAGRFAAWITSRANPVLSPELRQPALGLLSAGGSSSRSTTSAPGNRQQTPSALESMTEEGPASAAPPATERLICKCGPTSSGQPNEWNEETRSNIARDRLDDCGRGSYYGRGGGGAC